jgi:hypothetical protein
MAFTTRETLDAIGYSQNPVPIGGPGYMRFAAVDVWDGNQVVSIVMHKPMSHSLLTSVLLQCDPDEVQRYMQVKLSWF